MDQVKISIIMPCYNAEKYIDETMKSILGQTFSEWELIAVNDGSKDQTLSILEKYAEADPRVRVFSNEENMRLQKTLNRAIDLASGKYIARMDSDDICSVYRLEKQFAYMEAHPEIDLCCCKCLHFTDGKIHETTESARPGDRESVAALLLAFNPMVHPGVIAKSSVYKAHRYSAEFTCTEDMRLWTELVCDGLQIAVMDDYLLLYRHHAGQVTANSHEKQTGEMKRIYSDFYAKTIGGISEEETNALLQDIYFHDSDSFGSVVPFLKKIRKLNKNSGFFSSGAIRNLQKEVLFTQKYNNRLSGTDLLKEMLKIGPGFTIAELFRHSRNSRKDRKKIQEAFALFEEQGYRQ